MIAKAHRQSDVRTADDFSVIYLPPSSIAAWTPAEGYGLDETGIPHDTLANVAIAVPAGSTVAMSWSCPISGGVQNTHRCDRRAADPHQGTPRTSFEAGIPSARYCCRPDSTRASGELAFALHSPQIWDCVS